jgi:ribosomal protein S27AE
VTDVEEGAVEEEEFECPTCGAGVRDEDTVCPNCGEEFDE